MTPDDIYQFFGSANKASKAIGVTRAVVSKWTTTGYIPLVQQQKFELFTKHALIANIEHSKKPKKKSETTYYLPLFRYYDKKYGMCDVESIIFRKGKAPKITYCRGKSKIEKFNSFDTERLVQAMGILDKDGNMVYEGDICLLSNRERFHVQDMICAKKLSKLGKFKVIRNVLEK